jgi:anti-sigma factor ChrR (cupin superfamily)
VSTITVRVTAADVRRGMPDDPLRCPVARALWRATGRRWFACRPELVMADEDPDPNADRLRLETPAEVSRWMGDFDHGRGVGPLAFTLDVPDGRLTRE